MKPPDLSIFQLNWLDFETDELSSNGQFFCKFTLITEAVRAMLYIKNDYAKTFSILFLISSNVEKTD